MAIVSTLGCQKVAESWCLQPDACGANMVCDSVHNRCGLQITGFDAGLGAPPDLATAPDLAEPTPPAKPTRLKGSQPPVNCFQALGIAEVKDTANGK